MRGGSVRGGSPGSRDGPRGAGAVATVGVGGKGGATGRGTSGPSGPAAAWVVATGGGAEPPWSAHTLHLPVARFSSRPQRSQIMRIAPPCPWSCPSAQTARD